MKLKSNQSGAAHIVGILAVIVIVVIGVAGWKVWKANDKKSPAQQSNNSSVLSIEEITAGLKQTYTHDGFLKIDTVKTNNAAKYPTAVAYSAPGSTTLASTPTTSSLYLVVHQSGVVQHGASITDQQNLDKNAKLIANKLTTNGFSFVNNPPITVKEPDSIKNPPYNHADNGYYVSDTDVCLLGSSADVSTSESPTLYMDCVTRAALKTVALAATPFDTAYSAFIKDNPARVGDGDLAAKVYFSSPKVKDSKAKGYKYAEVGITSTNIMSGFSATGYFYTDAKGSNWRFAEASQQGAYCSPLKTEDAKIALADICSDGPR